MSELSGRSLLILVTVIEEGTIEAAALVWGLSPSGIDWHIRACQTAFGGVTREQAIVIAIQRGLVDPQAVRVKHAA